MRIGIDCDGVLCDFNQSFINRVIQVTGKDLFPLRPFDIPTWHYPQFYGYSEEEMAFPNGPVWASIIADDTFWYKLFPYDGVVEFLCQLNSNEHEFYFITNRAGVMVKAQTENWLDFHSFGLKTEAFGYPTVLVSSEKGMCARALKLDLYIDDNTPNCLDVNAASPTTRVVMLARPWNTAQMGILRAESLQQFEALMTPA